MATVNAYFYDGTSSKKYAVVITPGRDGLVVQGEGITRAELFAEMRISDRLGNSPRRIYFAGGGHCEVIDVNTFEQVLNEAGFHPPSLVVKLEGSWRYALLALLCCIAFAFAAYRWGLPWIAKTAAERIPYSTAYIIDQHVMQQLQKGILQPSRLPLERRQAIQHRFDILVDEAELPSHPLEFHNSKIIGANAFALPGGTVVVTDDLVNLASDDDEVTAVLAHELGHVSERHALRQLVQSSVVALFMTWYMGDVSNLLAAAPTLMLQAKYSREFETRADHFAVEMLHKNHISADCLADMLRKLEKSQRQRKQSSSFGELFASHPATEARIRALYDKDDD